MGPKQEQQDTCESVMQSGSVLGQRVDVGSYELIVERLLDWAEEGRGRYVCVSNVHMVMEGHDDSKFRGIVNDADLVTADGMPLVWMLRLQGIRTAQRVRGPTLMVNLIAAAESRSIRVGFYGGTPSTISLLRGRLEKTYPNLIISYCYSPPFRALSPIEDAQTIEDINSSRTQLLFVGLGCPKQERWMARHVSRLSAVLVGTGAAFDFIAGVQPEAPVFLQRLGLEWSFRLATEPRRLWRRYWRHNSRFIVFAAQSLIDHLKR